MASGLEIAVHGLTVLDRIRPMQDDAGPVGVQVPIFPLIVAILGLVAIVVVSVGALRLPRLSARRRAERPRPPKPAPKPVVHAPEPAPPQPVTPIYRKAPLSVHFPMIKPQHPDVWGIKEKATIALRVEDRGLLGQREIPGLSCQIDGTVVPFAFNRGQAAVERTFPNRGEVPIVVELKVKGERLPRRNTRILRIVEYREEIADLFAQFKDEASRTITPLRPDATPWEIYDALIGANARLSQVALRELVSSFEEAKFSNHPVDRDTYEKMLHALRVLRSSEG